MVVSPKTPLESEMVACLIDKETGSWDIDKVKGVFLPHEAEAILELISENSKIRAHLISDGLISGGQLSLLRRQASR
nr:hypothetical protein CFP56_56841 [Quercus suber]